MDAISEAMVRTAAAAQYAAYDDFGTGAPTALGDLLDEAGEWTAPSLNLHPSGFENGDFWTYADGVFTNGLASAFVAQRGGQLVVSFRGSDDNLLDYLDALHPQAQLIRLAPLLRAVLEYVRDDPSVKAILVTGHSLGGELAELFVALCSDTLTQAGNSSALTMNDVHLVTFGSPGTPLFLSPVFRSDLSAFDLDADGQPDTEPLPIVFSAHLGTALGIGNTEDLVFKHLGIVSPLSGIFTNKIATVEASSLDNVAGEFESASALGIIEEHSSRLYYQVWSETLSFTYLDVFRAILGSQGGSRIRALATEARPVAGTANDNHSVSDHEHLYLGLDGNDLIRGLLSSAQPLFASGGGGHDTLTGGGFSDFLDGGVGDDALTGLGGHDNLYGGGGADFLEGGDGGDTLAGGGDSDRYSIGVYQGADVISDQGGTGSDILALSTGALFSAFEYEWFSRDGEDLLIRARDGGGELALDIRIVDMGQPHGAIERIELYAGTGDVQTDAWDLAALWAGLGTDGPDTISGAATLSGGGGDDFLMGGSTPDLLVGGSGNDVLIGLDGADTLIGGADDDNFSAGAGSDSLSGGTGNDVFSGGLGADTIDGGAGDDIASANQGEGAGDRFDGGAGVDRVDIALHDINQAQVFSIADIASPTGHTFAGGVHVRNVEVVGNLSTGAGNDRGTYGAAHLVGNQSWSAGEGEDTLVVDLTGSSRKLWTVHIGPNSGSMQVGDGATQVGLDYSSIEHLVLTGGTADDRLLGTIGSDTLAGAGGADELRGRDGADSLSGGAANDYLDGGLGADSIEGGDGDDFINTNPGEGLGDRIDGGAGVDQLDLFLNEVSQAQVFSMAMIASAAGHTFAGGTHVRNVEAIRHLITGAGNDRGTYTAAYLTSNLSWVAGSGDDTLVVDLTGSSRKLAVFPRSGDTGSILIGEGPSQNSLDYSGIEHLILTGGSADDQLRGTPGSDTLTGGSGADQLDSGSGSDSLSGGVGNDFMIGRGGTDTLDGGAGDDDIRGEGENDKILAGDGNDLLSGGDGGDSLSGGNGNDHLQGDAGHDSLDGGVNNDTLAGGSGNDLLIGGRGNDVLRGDEGADVFVFSRGPGRDSVGDFLVGTDHLRLIDGLAVKSWSQAGSDTVIVFNEPAAQVTLVGVTGLTAATFGSLFDI